MSIEADSEFCVLGCMGLRALCQRTCIRRLHTATSLLVPKDVNTVERIQRAKT